MSESRPANATPFLRTIGGSALNCCRWCRQPMQWGKWEDGVRWWVCKKCDNLVDGQCRTGAN